MKSLTINQTIDVIATYIDENKPSKIPQELRNELNHLRKLKMAHPKGGLLPYPKSHEIELIIKTQCEPFSFVQNFNRASKFSNNQIAELAY